LGTIFPADHLTGAKMGFKPNQNATNWQYKHLNISNTQVAQLWHRPRELCNNSAAGSFHTKKLCSRIYFTEIKYYSKESKKLAF